MKKIISVRFAQIGLVTTLSLLTVFHFAILSGIIPFTIVWGDRLKNRARMESSPVYLHNFGK